MNTINWSNKARKQLLKLPRQDGAKIFDETEALKHFPDCKNIKKLADHTYDYRLRVGRYRVFFNFDGAVKVVAIEEVKRRNDHTY